VKSRKNAISHPILRVGHKTTIVRHCSLQLQVSIAYWPIGYYTIHTTHSHTQNKSKQLTRSFFIDFHITQQRKKSKSLSQQQLSSSLFSFSQPSKFQQSTTGPPPTTLFLTSHREIQISDNNSGGSPVIQSPPAIVSYSIYLFSPSANSIMI
jgi:hypothetical protein